MGGIRRRKKHAGHGGNKNKREAGQPGNYKDIVRENEMYAKFFGKQKLCSDEKELALMVDTMKQECNSIHLKMSSKIVTKIITKVQFEKEICINY